MFLLGAWRNAEPTDDQVQEALDRLQTSLSTAFLIEDRRMSLQKLDYIAKQYPKDQEDEDTVKIICGLLITIFEEETMGKQLAEMAIKDKSRFFDPILFNLGHSGHQTQADCISVLNKMLEDNEQVEQKLQEDLLITPDSVQILTRCIEHDHTRLLSLELIAKLSKSQPDIQRMVVFAGAAERALEIIEEEGGLAIGGMTARACLELVHVLLRDNHGNQEYLASQPAFKRALILFDFDRRSLAEYIEKYMETVSCAWSMFSSFISLDYPKLASMQQSLHHLFPKAVEYSIIEDCEEASEFLVKMLWSNNAVRLQFLKLHINSHSAIYLLVKEALSTGCLHLIEVFGSLLANGSRYSDGQLAVASTMAPGAESPGLLIVEQVLEDFTATVKTAQSIASAFQLLTYVLYGNNDVKFVLSRYKTTDGTLLEHIVTQLLFLSTASDRALVTGLSCLIVWCDESEKTCKFILDEMGGIVQCLLERILRASTKKLDTAICGLSAFLLALLVNTPQSQDFKGVIKARIGADWFTSRLDRLSESPLLLKQSLITRPLVSIFRSKYPTLRSLLLPPPLDARDELIRYLKMQLSDSDGTAYRQLCDENSRLKQDNAALLEQLMHSEGERQELMAQIGSLEQQLGVRASSSILKNLRAVLMPEFEDVPAKGAKPLATQSPPVTSQTMDSVVNI